MTKSIRMGLVALCAMAITACGGDEGAKVASKEQAAGLAMGAAQMAGQAQPGARLAALASKQTGFDASLEHEADCKDGGTLKFKMDLEGLGDTSGIGEGGSFDGSFAYDFTFDGCRDEAWDNPETEEVEEDVFELSGTMNYKMDISGLSGDGEGTASGAFKIITKGDLEVAGTYSDSLKMDLTQELKFSTTDTTASAEMVLNGSVETSSEKFTFENETYSYSGSTTGL